MENLSSQAVLETSRENKKLNCSVVSTQVSYSLGEEIVVVLVGFGFLLSRVKRGDLVKTKEKIHWYAWILATEKWVSLGLVRAEVLMS